VTGKPGLRPARAEDAAAIATIYAHHVLHGSSSFEVDPPTAQAMAQRMADVAVRGLPWLVAEDGGRVVAYAYASTFRPRPAYRYTVEDSVYVAPGSEGQGFGRVLLARLIAECERQGYRQMLAVIGDSANHASIGLHEAQGFVQAGLLRSVGFKHGRWVDVVIMQRALGPADTRLPGR
jgi:phosphinothricin acetyltransferase